MINIIRFCALHETFFSLQVDRHKYIKEVLTRFSLRRKEGLKKYWVVDFYEWAEDLLIDALETAADIGFADYMESKKLIEFPANADRYEKNKLSYQAISTKIDELRVRIPSFEAPKTVIQGEPH
jgi:hypothetical protein